MWKEKIMEAVTSAVSSLFQGLAEAAIELLLMILAKINSISINVLEYDFVVQGIIYTQVVALALLTVKIAYESMNTYILRISGDASQDPGGILIRAIVSTAIICGIPWIMLTIFNIGLAVSQDISNLPGNDPALGLEHHFLIQLLKAFGDAMMFLLLVAVMILVAIVIIFIVLIQTAIRSAELALIGIAGPIMAIGLNSNMFGTWWKKLLSLVITQAAQLMMLRLSFYIFHKVLFNMEVVDLIIFIGFLWVTVTTPKIIDQFVQSTGVGRLIAGSAQSASTLMIMRKVMMRR